MPDGLCKTVILPAVVLLLLAAGPAPAATRPPADAVLVSMDLVAEGAVTPFVHAPTIAVLPSGELAVAWYGASHNRGRDAAVYGSRSLEGGRRWSEPAVWGNTPGLPDANPVLFADPQGHLWLFYATRVIGWAAAWLRYRRADDEGLGWGAPGLLTWVPGYLPRTKPVVLADGSWVLPVYHEEWGSRILRSQDQGASWSWSNWLVSDPLNIQPAVVEVSPGRLLALMRNRGPQGLAWASNSRDGGRTWTPPTLTRLRNPDASLDLIRLRNGSLAVVYNDSARHRHALAVALSADGGRSWPAQVLLEGCATIAEETSSYPAMVEGHDGTLHVVYAYGGSRIIRYARLDPKRIAAAGHTPGRCEEPEAAASASGPARPRTPDRE